MRTCSKQGTGECKCLSLNGMHTLVIFPSRDKLGWLVQIFLNYINVYYLWWLDKCSDTTSLFVFWSKQQCYPWLESDTPVASSMVQLFTDCILVLHQSFKGGWSPDLCTRCFYPFALSALAAQTVFWVDVFSGYEFLAKLMSVISTVL